MNWPMVQVRHVARLEYGSSLPAADRIEGDIAVFGSNGPVGQHNSCNTGSPVVVVGRKGSHGKLQYSSSPVFAIDTTYFIDATCTQAHIRWLYYALSTLELDKTGQDVGVPGLSREYAYSQRVPLPSHIEQRAIADYLDTETNRIDTLITKKRRMIELFEERRAGTVEAQIRELAALYGESPLKFHTPRILVGIVITPAAYYADSGIPALRGINIKPGYLDLDDLVYLSEDAHMLHSKSRLFHGDIVVVRTGQAGAACVVPPDLDGSNCVDLLIVRSSSVLDSGYLKYVINSDWTIKHIEKHSVGTIQSHFNVESLKQLPIPVPSLDVQQETAAALDHATGQIDSLLQEFKSQIKLLTERRQALITAAVTGELSVT